MTEFERAKRKYEKKAAKVVPIKEAPKNEVHITVYDGGKEYKMVFAVPMLAGTRLASKRNAEAYKEACASFIHKEFGKWQLIPR